MEQPECIWQANAQLGEGVRYDAYADEVWWVDILGQKIFCLSLQTGEKWVWDTPETVATTFPSGRDDVLALFRHSLVRMNRQNGTFSTVLVFEDEPSTNRFNDGTVGPDGSLWVGSMDFDFQVPTGAVYRVLRDLTVETVDRGYIVANGPALSRDGRRMFVNETMKGEIFQFDIDEATGKASNKRLFVQVPAADGLPDGLCVDSDDGVWVSLVTGGKVRRYRRDGTVEREILMPSPTVTSVCIGGRDNGSLFITTGRILMDDATLDAHPLSGGLFRFRKI